MLILRFKLSPMNIENGSINIRGFIDHWLSDIPEMSSWLQIVPGQRIFAFVWFFFFGGGWGGVGRRGPVLKRFIKKNRLSF